MALRQSRPGRTHDDPTRIVHVIPTLHMGGAEAMLCRLLGGADRDRFEMHVACLRGEGAFAADLKAMHIPVHGMGLAPGGSPVPILLRLSRLVRELQPDLIHGWMYHSNVLSSFAQFLSLRRIPVIWGIRHSIYRLTDESPATAALIRLSAPLSRCAARIIYNARISAEQHRALGFAPARSAVIPNGFDCERFKPSAAAREAMRRQLGLDDRCILIGRIGRFHPMKDHANFLQAAALVAARHEDVRFLLAGEGIGRDNPDLMNLVEQARLADRVHLIGARKDIADVSAALDIATSSSFSEGFPNVIGEAMACGIPCVATDVGHSAELVGETGVVVRPRDPEALAAGWIRLIDAGRSARTRLGMDARRRIIDEFSLGRVIRQYETLYDQTVRTAPLRRQSVSSNAGGA